MKPPTHTLDPLTRLTRSDRREWRAAAKRAQREHEAEQLATLQGLARSGSKVTGMVTEESSFGFCDPVEMIIEGRRIRAWRVYRPALARLREALTTIAHVPLSSAGRYGPYWVLTFKVATEPLVILVDRLTLLPEWGGSQVWAGAPVGPVVGVTV
jgi:hypothetical protein